MGKPYKVKYLKMTDEEQKEWARAYATLCLDLYEKEYGALPAPPSDEEFHRLWDEIVNNKIDPKP